MPKVPSVAREIFLIKFKTKTFDLKKILLCLAYVFPGVLKGSLKKFCSFGPSDLPAIAYR